MFSVVSENSEFVGDGCASMVVELFPEWKWEPVWPCGTYWLFDASMAINLLLSILYLLAVSPHRSSGNCRERLCVVDVVFMKLAWPSKCRCGMSEISG